MFAGTYPINQSNGYSKVSYYTAKHLAKYDDIEFKENGTQDQYEKVEKSIQQVSCLISCIILNEESKKLYSNLDEFLEKEIAIYEEKKCISKKIRIVCKNSISELRNYMNKYSNKKMH